VISCEFLSKKDYLRVAPCKKEEPATLRCYRFHAQVTLALAEELGRLSLTLWKC
jgi:hypothetical protein